MIDFNGILRLPADWVVYAVEPKTEALNVRARIDSKPTILCHCEHRSTWERNGSLDRTYTGHPVAGRRLELALEIQKYRCKRCRTIYVPDQPPRGMLPGFRIDVANFALRHSVTAAAREYKISRERVQRAMDHIVEERLAIRQTLPPRYIGIDDTLISGSRRAIVLDIERKVYLDILEGYSRGHVADYIQSNYTLWRETLCAVVIDPYKAYRLALVDVCPEVPVILDRFHVMKIVLDALDKYLSDYSQKHRLKGLRVLNKPTSPAAQELRLRYPQHQEMFYAVDYVHELKGLYETESSQAAHLFWNAWYRAQPLQLTPHFGRRVADLDRYWIHEICEAVNHRTAAGSIVTNGPLEALHKRVQLASLQGAARSFSTMRARMLTHPDWNDGLLSGRLDPGM